MSTVRYLVVGANRGLGLEFARQLLQKPNTKVVATYRDATKIDALKKLSSEQSNAGRLELVRLDMSDDSGCKAAAHEVKSKVGALDVLIINAGICGPDKHLLDENVEDVGNMFSNNVLGPLRIAQHFTPLLSRGQSKMIFLSTELGSIERGKHGSLSSYSISKAALNMLGRKLSYELQSAQVAVALIDPGWVQTDMGGSHALLTPLESIGGMLKVIDQINMENSGEYWQWNGQRNPW